MTFDLHTHSTYSDGSLMYTMVSAAEQQGLDKIGFADHANVSSRKEMKTQKYRNGFNLDKTYERRKKAINSFNEETNVKIYNAVEMDYDPRDENEIEDFFNQKGFDYTLGSVHFLEGVNIHAQDYFAKKSREQRKKLVKKYFDKLEKLIKSGLFDVASHPDLFERNPSLRNLAERKDYLRIADAFKKSKTIPEINTGRALKGLGEVHPTENFLKILMDENISFTRGTDSHRPDDIQKLNIYMDEKFSELGIQAEKPAVLND